MQRRGEQRRKNTTTHSLQSQALPCGRATVTGTEGRSSCCRVSWRATGAKGRGDRATGTARAGLDPGVPGRAHSGNHCYTSAPEREHGAHLEYPKSEISHVHHHQVSLIQKLLQAPS